MHLKQLRQPAGRAPGGRALALHRWYTGLSAEDQRKVDEVIRNAAHAAAFEFLCVLDGVVTLDDPPHAELRLVAMEPDGSETLLTEWPGELHDEFNALVHPLSEPWPGQDSELP